MSAHALNLPSARETGSLLRRLALFVFLAVLGAALLNPALAKEAAPRAEDELVEKRMVAISEELRCLVCQNESLAGSNAELANDLRREIRTLIKDGKSDSEIMDFMVDRYGDFVRYRPPMKGTTLVLWFGPALLFIVGLVALVRYLRRRDVAVGEVSLSPEEQKQAASLLSRKDPEQ